MRHSISLSAATRAALLNYLRRSSAPEVRGRSHIIILLLADATPGR